MKFKSKIGKNGIELYIQYEEVDKKMGRYDIFDREGKPLYRWADQKTLARFVGAVELGDAEYLDSLKQDDGVRGEWTDVHVRSWGGDKRPLIEAVKKMHEAVVGKGK